MFTIAPRPFIRLFTHEQDVIEAAIPKLLIISWSYVLHAPAQSVLGVLRGLKRSAPPYGDQYFRRLRRAYFVDLVDLSVDPG